MSGPIRDFLIDANGDLAVVNGDFATVGSADAVPQGIAIRARTFLGEIFTDESQGVDYIGQVLIKNPDPLVVRELVREAIADSPDVTSVVGAQLQITGRNGTLDYEVSTVYGAQVSATLEVP